MHFTLLLMHICMIASTQSLIQMENSNLLEEILIDIFSRLPPKSVGRCRVLSKLWHRNLSTSQFIKLHLKVYKTQQKNAILVTQDRCAHTITIPLNGADELVSRKLDFPASFDYVVDSCDGLVLLMTNKLIMSTKDEMFVVNPLTLQQVSIRNTPLSDAKGLQYIAFSYGFGYDTSCDDYKAVKLTHDETGTSVYVYSMKNDVWKRLGNSPYDHGIHCEEDSGVFVNGAMHWLAMDEDDDQYVIAAFDLATESFRGIPVLNYKSEHGLYRLYAIGGCLVMLDPEDDVKLDMWIMKEYGLVNSWTNFSIASPSAGLEPLCFIEENVVVFTTEKGTLLIWNLTEGITKEIDDDGGALSRSNCGRMFVPSLVSPI